MHDLLALDGRKGHRPSARDDCHHTGIEVIDHHGNTSRPRLQPAIFSMTGIPTARDELSVGTPVR